MARAGRRAAGGSDGKNCRTAMPERIYHAAAYVRLSVEDNRRAGQKESIAMQQYMLEKYIEGQPDMELWGVYCDNGETGTDFARPGFEHMMEMIRERKIDCIVVKDLSRFGRNYVETGYYLEKILPCLGVRFVAVNDSYDTLKDEGGDEMVLSLKNLVNDLYAKDISRKTGSSLNIKRKNGEYIGAVPPYGYLKSPEDKHKLAIDPEAASVVRDIFRWRAEGMGIVQIVRRLNEAGIPSPSLYYYQKGYAGKNPSESGRLWKAWGVGRMMGNPVYAGHMAQGKTRKSLSEGLPKQKVSREEWIIVKNTHPPIVAQEIFDRVQELQKERCRRSLVTSGRNVAEKKNCGIENIFKGLLVCADCGGKMARHKNVGAKGTVRYAFVCSIYEQNRGRRGCTKKYVREQDVQEAASRFLRLQMALNMERPLQPMRTQSVICGQGKVAGNKINRLRQKMKRNTALRGNLYESFCDGIVTKAEYLSLKAEYDRETRELEEELTGFQEDMDADAASGHIFCGNKDRFMTRQMALELIRSIQVSGYNELEIVWSFQDDFARMAEKRAY